MKGRHLLFCVLIFSLLLLPCAAQAEEEDPVVEFYITHYIGHVNRESSVTVLCRTPRRIAEDNNLFELRNHRGEVLAVKAWRDPDARLTFTFTVPERFLGGNALTVWWNGENVTAVPAYAAYSDLEDRRVTQLTPERPALALTIVCGGGGSRQVDEILAVLERHQIRATFFLGGGWLESHVEEARRIVSAGHEIGSHGYQHLHMTEMQDYRRMRCIITAMNRRCEELLGVRPRLFRAPYSDTNQKVTALVRAEGMEEIQWSLDSMDWSDEYRSQRKIIRRVSGDRAISGAIIQFHLNGHGTAQVLDEVIPLYRQSGLQVVTVGELLRLSGREIPPMPDLPDDD